MTLTATSDDGATFRGWGGHCSGLNRTTSVVVTHEMDCTATFTTGGTPVLQVSPSVLNFDSTALGTAMKRTVTVTNAGDAGLKMAMIALAGDSEFSVSHDSCSLQEVIPQGKCSVEITFQPAASEAKTATLTLGSNASDQPTTVDLMGTGCRGGGDSTPPRIQLSPTLLNFGVTGLGQSSTLTQMVRAVSSGCGALQVDQFRFSGPQVSEFRLENEECYYGELEGEAYSACQYAVVFTPTSEGPKNAQLLLTFNDPAVAPSVVPMQARASFGEPQLVAAPSAVDFGSLTIPTQVSQIVTLSNVGKVNVELYEIEVEGEFTVEGCLEAWLFPGRQCQFTAQFAPLTKGEKLGRLSVATNAASTPTVVEFHGTAVELFDCADESMTIRSVQNGAWGDNATWDLSRPPNPTDLVKIKSGHLITAPTDAMVVRALCLDADAGLVSADNRSTSLSIRATEYLKNQGTIQGQDGREEMNAELCTSREAVGQGGCAYPGASVLIVVGSEVEKVGKLGDWWWYGLGGPVLNEGTIKGGHGGQGSRQSAGGGEAIVLGRNSVNRGVIQAGNGGNLSGTQADGEAGRGGLAQLWGKLGGPGYLYNYGDITGGNGGECMTAMQSGGSGGNLWLVSLPEVYLHGTQTAGTHGASCAGASDGFVQIEPSIISVAGATTGGDVTIFGGNNWVLDLRNLNQVVVTATGNLTLAVGTGGVIDLRGNTQPILAASGSVNLFADKILMETSQRLTDLITAPEIVVGPSKLLREVSLVSLAKVSGRPGTTVSLPVTLSNSGPEADTYQVTVSDSAGWALSFFPTSVTVAGLETVGMELSVTLPNSLGAVDVIQVTAISEADSKVSSTTEMRVEVAEQPEVISPLVEENSEVVAKPVVTSSLVEESSEQEGVVISSLVEDNLNVTQPTAIISELSEPPLTKNEEERGEIQLTEMALETNVVERGETHQTPEISPVAVCPPTGVIDQLCDNRGRVITDVILTTRAIVSGGELAGTIDNQGFVSNVTVRPGAVLKGGTVSGYVVNHGTVRDCQFVGAEIRGGQVAGTLVNASKVGGVLRDLTLASHARIVGGRVQGQIVGDSQAPAVLEKVQVLRGSRLTGVRLAP